MTEKSPEVHPNSQGPEDQNHCLKCGKSIAHIPYKYEGKTFHARCLVCNFCGRNLSGKPFTIEDQNLFCGQLCNQNFLSGPPMSGTRSTQINSVSEEISRESDPDISQNESLMEALDSINQESTNADSFTQDPDQITDYPRHTATLGIGSSQISLSGSMRSSLSLSAVSESSFTSDYSYDANRKPTKKILKNPHRPHHRTRKNVRWNLNSEYESDTTSLDSFDSTSTSSSLFLSARKGVHKVRQNWKEFEKSPPQGSTGLTPHKPQYGSRFISRPSSAPIRHVSLTNFVPQLEPTQEHIQESSFGNALHSTQASQCGPRLTRSPSPQERFSQSPLPENGNTKCISKVSPLTSTPSNAIQRKDSSGFEKLQRTVQSPIKRYSSDSTILKSPSLKTGLSRDASPDDTNREFVLQLSESKVPELEESTLEDRQRMHVFQFPQTSKHTFTTSPAIHAVNTGTPRKAFLEDDDEEDYDHLSPLKTSTDSEIKQHDLREKNTNQKQLRSFTEDDLNDALKQIDEANSQLSSQDSNSVDLKPPPIPVKHRSGMLASVEVGKQKQKITVELQRRSSDPISNPVRKSTLPSRQPPPVPPKLNRLKRNLKSSSGSLINIPHQQSSEVNREKNSENILPPPPEFAAPPLIMHIDNSSPNSDDLLGSTSTNTLIAEQDIPSSNDHSHVSSQDVNSSPLNQVLVRAEDPLPSKYYQMNSIIQTYGFNQRACDTSENTTSTYLQPQHNPNRQNTSTYLQPQHNPNRQNTSSFLQPQHNTKEQSSSYLQQPNHHPKQQSTSSYLQSRNLKEQAISSYQQPQKYSKDQATASFLQPQHTPKEQAASNCYLLQQDQKEQQPTFSYFQQYNRKVQATSSYVHPQYNPKDQATASYVHPQHINPKDQATASYLQPQHNSKEQANLQPRPNPKDQNTLQPQGNSIHKVSMETAFNEGNLLRNNAYISRNQYPFENSKRPNRPAPLPPAPKNISENPTVRILGGKQAQTSKPVDPSVKQLLHDLNIKDEDHQHSCNNICAVCSKELFPNQRDNVTYSKCSYHAKCFFCSKCRVFLHEKITQSYYGKLYCQQCYKNVLQTNSRPRDYHRTAASQITTV